MAAAAKRPAGCEEGTYGDEPVMIERWFISVRSLTAPTRLRRVAIGLEAQQSMQSV